MTFCQTCGRDLKACICGEPDLGVACVCAICDAEFRSPDLKTPLCPTCQAHQDAAYAQSYEAPIGDPLRLGATGTHALDVKVRQFSRAQGDANWNWLARTVHGPGRTVLCGDCGGEAERSVITESGKSLPLCEADYRWRSARLLTFADLSRSERRSA